MTGTADFEVRAIHLAGDDPVYTEDPDDLEYGKPLFEVVAAFDFLLRANVGDLYEGA